MVNGHNVGPYCAIWDRDAAPWCYLAGYGEAKMCEGAVKSRNGDYYWTMDSEICQSAALLMNRKSN